MWRQHGVPRALPKFHPPNDIQCALEMNIVRSSVIVWVVSDANVDRELHCQRLASEFNLYHLSIEQMLEDEMASGSDMGRLVESYVTANKKVPTCHQLCLLYNIILRKRGGVCGFLLDGYPLDLKHALKFERKLFTVDLLLYFESSTALALSMSESEQSYGAERFLSKQGRKQRAQQRQHNANVRALVEHYRNKTATLGAQLTDEEAYEGASKAVDCLLKIRFPEIECAPIDPCTLCLEVATPKVMCFQRPQWHLRRRKRRITFFDLK